MNRLVQVSVNCKWNNTLVNVFHSTIVTLQTVLKQCIHCFVFCGLITICRSKSWLSEQLQKQTHQTRLNTLNTAHVCINCNCIGFWCARCSEYVKLLGSLKWNVTFCNILWFLINILTLFRGFRSEMSWVYCRFSLNVRLY